ncbi:class I SAM-dependent methyltransferase [Vibrio sp.]|uniref:class I SAM-dependent methyltransferase n=1 Tax=Vibrio sp. TaxID=678 RepID=UPI003D0B7B55
MQVTERFTNRVDDYQRYRPNYPQTLIDVLISESKLKPLANVADIGSGTGIFSERLLEQGLEVVGVEANQAMRQQAEDSLAGNRHFRSQSGRAEATELPDQSIDLITAAQSFHWFCNQQTLFEFRRILKPGGWLALIWNQRDMESRFQQQYDQVLQRYATDYAAVSHHNLKPDAFEHFFAQGQMRCYSFSNQQRFNFDQLMGRFRSSSYSPAPASREYQQAEQCLLHLYKQYQQNEYISFDYCCRMYLGPIS